MRRVFVWGLGFALLGVMMVAVAVGIVMLFVDPKQIDQEVARGGSAEGMVRVQCQTRLTRERTAELRRHFNCPEGDLSCVRPTPKK